MVTGERLRIIVKGGAPWGFRLQGGGHFPLEVAKIRRKSHAFEADLREGDVVLSINGHQMSGKTHQSAMDIVEMSSNEVIFEVVRPQSTGGVSRVVDPQRQLRSVPEKVQSTAEMGLVSSARKQFTTQEGNKRHEINTDEYVMQIPGGKKITKTVTKERTITYPNKTELSPSTSQNVIPPGGHISRTPNRSPYMWQPPSLSPSQSQSNSLKIETQESIPKQGGLLSPRSPNGSQSRSPLMWQPKSTSPSPAGRTESHGRSESSLSGRSYGKENEDPLIATEQAKWEARQGPENVPKFKLENFGSVRVNKSPYVTIPRIDDPNYPMFEVPKPDWSLKRQAAPAPQPELQLSFPPPEIGKKQDPPPVPPKAASPAPPPIYFDITERPVAGSDRHRPGMIRPPAQLNVLTAPAPPPPQMPPMTSTSFGVQQPHLFQPEYTSSLKENGYDEVDAHRSRPDHLPVFAPKVYFAPDDDGDLQSPDRTGFADQQSDVSSLTKTDDSNRSTGSDSEKIFSDSAFYDDHTNRYPTIDEQMSMCKKIADSLTSAANKRARGARMFMKRKRKSGKWIHDQRGDLILGHGTSEYSSSAGDVADLDDLDSELYWDEGGNKPLFMFRIPKIAGQVSQGEKMSLTKEEFERLRLAAPKIDHQSVSPNVCFSIAADLHKGGRNKGAKLFQKRQARVEKFVIDDSNVQHSPVSPTRLEQIVQHQSVRSQPTPWEAAAKGNMDAAFDPKTPQRNFQPVLSPVPKHSLISENQPKVLGGRNYNTIARGWQSSGPGHQQQSYYRAQKHAPVLSVRTCSVNVHNSADSVPTSNVVCIKVPIAANLKGVCLQNTESDLLLKVTDTEGHEQQPSPAYQQQQQQHMWQQEDEGDDVDSRNKFGDYNRRIQAWPGATSQRTVQSYSEQTSYNSLPRGFGMQPKHEMSVSSVYCDL